MPMAFEISKAVERAIGSILGRVLHRNITNRIKRDLLYRIGSCNEGG